MCWFQCWDTGILPLILSISPAIFGRDSCNGQELYWRVKKKKNAFCISYNNCHGFCVNDSNKTIWWQLKDHCCFFMLVTLKLLLTTAWQGPPGWPDDKGAIDEPLLQQIQGPFGDWLISHCIGKTLAFLTLTEVPGWTVSSETLWKGCK